MLAGPGYRCPVQVVSDSRAARRKGPAGRRACRVKSRVVIQGGEARRSRPTWLSLRVWHACACQIFASASCQQPPPVTSLTCFYNLTQIRNEPITRKTVLIATAAAAGQPGWGLVGRRGRPRPRGHAVTGGVLRPVAFTRVAPGHLMTRRHLHQHHCQRRHCRCRGHPHHRRRYQLPPPPLLPPPLPPPPPPSKPNSLQLHVCAPNRCLPAYRHRQHWRRHYRRRRALCFSLAFHRAAADASAGLHLGLPAAATRGLLRPPLPLAMALIWRRWADRLPSVRILARPPHQNLQKFRPVAPPPPRPPRRMRGRHPWPGCRTVPPAP